MQREGVGAEDDVGLRGVALLAPAVTAHGGRRLDGRPRRLPAVALEPSFSPERVEQPSVLQVSGGGDHEVAAMVAVAVEALQIVGGDGGQRFWCSEDGIAVGMVRPHGRGVELEDEIVRRVGDAVDLFENHVPLGLEIALAEQRTPHQIGEDVHGERKILVENVGLVAGVVPAGERVEAAAADLQLEGELPGRPPLGALEHHVLEQMGDAHLRRATRGHWRCARTCPRPPSERPAAVR